MRTQDGRVEVLLAPAVFLRLGENSGVRMITNRLVDTRLELLFGEVLVQVDELLEGNAVTVTYQGYVVQFLKKGIYRWTAEPPELRVYSGEVSADLNGETKTVKEGHALAMNGNITQAKFDKKDVDDLYLWSRSRSEYMAMANVSAAKTLRDSGMYWGTTGWYWNPYFGMYTFIPLGGVLYDPWGFAFWSPFTVYGYLSSWPGYTVNESTSNSGSGSGSRSKSAPGAHHYPPGRIGHPPVPPPVAHSPAGVSRGVTLAGEAHRSVSAGSVGHGGGASGGSGHAGGSAFTTGGSSGGSSGGSGHSSSGGSAGSTSGNSGGGSHK